MKLSFPKKKNSKYLVLLSNRNNKLKIIIIIVDQSNKINTIYRKKMFSIAEENSDGREEKNRIF